MLFVVPGSNGVVCSADLSFLLQCDHNSRLQSTELIRLKSSITSFTSVGEIKVSSSITSFNTGSVLAEHHFAVSSMSELRDWKSRRDLRVCECVGGDGRSHHSG